MPTPNFPKPTGRQTAVGLALAAVLGISVPAAVDTMGDTKRNESGGKAHLCSYQDSVKIWTIGDGLIRYPDGRSVKAGDCITQDQNDAYYENEMVSHARPLARGIPQIFGKENQARALVDVSYNCGVGYVVNGAIGTNIRAGNWSAAKAHVLDCKRGSFPSVPPDRTAYGCVRKRAGGYLCTIRGLEARRLRNQARFAIDLPKQGAK